MNNIVYMAQVTGTIAIFIFFCLMFWISINPNSTKKTSKVANFWASIYVFFLFILRLLNIHHLGTIDQLRIISGFTTLIPLIAVIVNLFLQKKMEEDK